MAYELPEDSLQETIFFSKYAYPGEKSWKECARRVARKAADVETSETREITEKKFFDAINSGDFCPGGRILFGAGRSKYNMLNCYVLDPEDSVDSIGKVVSDMYKISCAGGGIGFNFSKIRPRGDDIQNIKCSAPGSISVMKMINEIGEHVRAGKNRRTALMAILNVSHPDFLEFLDVKLDRGELNNFNISVAITRRFISAVENNEEWYFTFGGRHSRYYTFEMTRTSELGDDTITVVAKDEEDALGRAEVSRQKHYKDIFSDVKKKPLMAKDIWKRIIDNAVESGEPGIFNIDFANEYTNVSYFEDMPATNPCGEEVLPAYGNCCLGHVNLSNMVDIDGNIDWRLLARTIRIGVLERLFATIRNEAYKASMYLAREKGSFSAYDFSKLRDEKFMKTLPPRIRSDIKKNGLRNAILLTVAPTGTISMVLGVSTGTHLRSRVQTTVEVRV